MKWHLTEATPHILVYDDSGVPVATVLNRRHAKLIKAAPRLLAACQIVLDRAGTGSIYCTDQIDGCTFAEILRVAIEEALGGNE
jgi:hypothetical protein